MLTTRLSKLTKFVLSWPLCSACTTLYAAAHGLHVWYVLFCISIGCVNVSHTTPQFWPQHVRVLPGRCACTALCLMQQGKCYCVAHAIKGMGFRAQHMSLPLLKGLVGRYLRLQPTEREWDFIFRWGRSHPTVHNCIHIYYFPNSHRTFNRKAKMSKAICIFNFTILWSCLEGKYLQKCSQVLERNNGGMSLPISANDAFQCL